jgi:hypothetical protein
MITATKVTRLLNALHGHAAAGLAKSPAMMNGRCRMHGGKSPGPPKGNRDARKHGFYSAATIVRRRESAKLLRMSRQMITFDVISSGLVESQSALRLRVIPIAG